VLGLVVAYLALTALFVAAGFPFDRLAPRVADALGSATGARATVGGLGFSISWLRPQLVARNVELHWPGGFAFALDRARIGPALSPSWLRGQPSLALSLDTKLGRLAGTARIGTAPAFRGELRGVALDKLPLDAFAPGLQLGGALDADLDLRAAGALPEGTAHLAGRNGSISLPNLPIGLPFAKLDADLALGGAALVAIQSLTLDGPLVAGSGSGTIGRGVSIDDSPLALDLRIDAREPSLRQLLASEGLAIGADGTAHLEIGGTLASPSLRAAGTGLGPRTPR
jgi:type II secretion system protein N